VNGFSFVKSSKKYYFDCAVQIRNMVMQYFYPEIPP